MLERDDIEAVARRVVELLDERDDLARAPVGLVDAHTLARRLHVKVGWIREHADELGAVRLGDGPRARMPFDLAVALEAMARRRVEAPVPRQRPTGGPPPVRPRRARRAA